MYLYIYSLQIFLGEIIFQCLLALFRYFNKSIIGRLRHPSSITQQALARVNIWVLLVILLAGAYILIEIDITAGSFIV